MVDDPTQLHPEIVEEMRRMARGGHSPRDMFRLLKKVLGSDSHILTILKYFRQAFGLSLSEVKPIAALSRNEKREIENDDLLNELLIPKIMERRNEWDVGR